MLLSRYGGSEVAYWPLGVSFLLHHTVMGFAIGASSLKINWAVHGAVWGALFGLFLAIGNVGGALAPWMAFVLPVIWGFLIEALATKAFKQPQYR
jgi:fatty acid desaturase